MRPETPLKELEALRKEEDALDQSVALNRIVMTLLESKRREDFWLRLILIISLLVNVVIAGIFIQYEEKYHAGLVVVEEVTTNVQENCEDGNPGYSYQGPSSPKG